MNNSLAPHPKGVRAEDVLIPAGGLFLEGELDLPRNATTVVIFAHAGGGRRHSRRNQFLGSVIRDAGMGTLLIDPLGKEEDPSASGPGVEIGPLAGRWTAAVRWLHRPPLTGGLAAGLLAFGIACAAALAAAAELGGGAGAVVARDGRAELAREAIARIVSPTLLIAGGDEEVFSFNRDAAHALRCGRKLQIVPGAAQLFEEPGETERVARLAAEWFRRHLGT